MCQRSRCEITDCLLWVLHTYCGSVFRTVGVNRIKTKNINNRNGAKESCNNNNKVFLPLFPKVAKLGVSARVI